MYICLFSTAFFLLQVTEGKERNDLGGSDKPKSAEYQVKKTAISSQQEIEKVI